MTKEQEQALHRHCRDDLRGGGNQMRDEVDNRCRHGFGRQTAKNAVVIGTIRKDRKK